LESGAFRRIFAPEKEELIGGWAKQHNEELHNLYSSPNKIRMIKSRWMRWAGNVERMWEKRNTCRIWRWRSPKERCQLEDKDVRGWIILLRPSGGVTYKETWGLDWLLDLLETPLTVLDYNS
jgi:hypothetical protein